MERVELHLHTEYSRDSSMGLQTIIGACKKRSITTLFVTDHNEIQGGQRLQQLAPFRVIPSEEITTSEGEIIGYFLKERIAPLQTPEATIAEIRRQGGIVSVPHPFDRLRHSAIRRATLKRILPSVDLLEVFNARNVFSADDKHAAKCARENNKLSIVVSDAHTRWEVGRSFVELPTFASPMEFLRALQHASLHPHRSPLWVHAVTGLTKMRKKGASSR